MVGGVGEVFGTGVGVLVPGCLNGIAPRMREGSYALAVRKERGVLMYLGCGQQGVKLC